MSYRNYHDIFRSTMETFMIFLKKHRNYHDILRSTIETIMIFLDVP